MNMSGRQNIESALSPGGALQIPCVICYEGIFVRDHWTEIVPYPWWYQYSPEIAVQILWRQKVIQTIGQDWFYLPSFYSKEERKHLSLETRPDGVYRIDSLMNREEKLVEPEIGGWSGSKKIESIHPEVFAQTPKEIDKFITSLDNMDLSRSVAEGSNDLAHILLKEFGNQLFPIRHVASPLWSCYGLWGFEGLMMMIATRPDLVQYACQRYLELAQSSIQYSALIGAAGIWIEECLTDMISPEAFKKLNLPFVNILVDEISSLGLKSIYYFCGNPVGKWDLLLASGADAISLEESKKGFTLDIESIVKNVHGTKTILGNLDTIRLLPDANEKVLRDEVQRQIEAGRKNGNRFIMGVGSPITPMTPVERVQLYVKLAKELGQCYG